MTKESSLERMTSKEGVEYRIVDDGNCHTMHLFTIEKCIYTETKRGHLAQRNGKYWDRVPGHPVTADWKTAYETLKLCVERCVQ